MFNGRHHHVHAFVIGLNAALAAGEEEEAHLLRYLSDPRMLLALNEAQWLSNFLYNPLPMRGGTVCLVPQLHLTQQPTIPLKLTVWSKETKKLKRAFPWWQGCNNTTAKLNHFSVFPVVRLPACLPPANVLSLSALLCSSSQFKVLTLLAENCPIWFDQYSVLEALARLAMLLALILASLNTGGACSIYL